MIAFDKVSKSYDRGATYTVKDVSFTVERGQLLVLLGGSGCGKTTTLKMINRLIDPSAGRIEVDGQDVCRCDPVRLRRDIGYVIQGSGLFPHMTVADNIAVVPKLLGWEPGRIARRVDEMLELVQLEPGEYRARMPRQLSGGQQQRVGFGRALAADPKMMLLDEPFGALDPVTRDKLRDDFQQIRRRLNLTAVMVTHDMTEALLLADVIAVMDRVEVGKNGRQRAGANGKPKHHFEGRLVRLGSPHELLTNPGHPTVQALMESPKRQADQLEALAAGTRNGTQP